MVLSELSSIFRTLSWRQYTYSAMQYIWLDSFWALQFKWALFICTLILCRPRLRERQSCILLVWGTMDDWCRLVLDTFVWWRIFQSCQSFIELNGRLHARDNAATFFKLNSATVTAALSTETHHTCHPRCISVELPLHLWLHVCLIIFSLYFWKQR